MNAPSLLLANKVISDYSEIKRHFQSKFLSNCTTVIDSIAVFSDNAKKINRETSKQFNILRFFKTDENKHSELLTHLLNPHGNHGQGNLFLNLFLKRIGIEFSENDNWIVLCNREYVDILLKRNNPHAVVIIENKSHGAVDQEHQLYRYWKKAIYDEIKVKNLSKDFINKPPDEKYQIVYLTHGSWKTPDEKSLMRPDYFAKDLPEKLPMKYKHLTFNEDIVNWLKESLNIIPKSNPRLQEYIKQYIEFWA